MDLKIIDGILTIKNLSLKLTEEELEKLQELVKEIIRNNLEEVSKNEHPYEEYDHEKWMTYFAEEEEAKKEDARNRARDIAARMLFKEKKDPRSIPRLVSRELYPDGDAPIVVERIIFGWLKVIGYLEFSTKLGKYLAEHNYEVDGSKFEEFGFTNRKKFLERSNYIREYSRFNKYRDV